MSEAVHRLPIHVRLKPEDKATFERGANAVGLEAGTACRQIIELVVNHMRETGCDYLDALQIVKNALKVKAPV